jgi:hypothetical protein
MDRRNKLIWIAMLQKKIPDAPASMTCRVTASVMPAVRAYIDVRSLDFCDGVWSTVVIRFARGASQSPCRLLMNNNLRVGFRYGH